MSDSVNNINTPASPTKGFLGRKYGQVWAYQTGDNNEWQFTGFTKREEASLRILSGLVAHGGLPPDKMIDVAINMTDDLFKKLEDLERG